MTIERNHLIILKSRMFFSILSPLKVKDYVWKLRLQLYEVSILSPMSILSHFKFLISSIYYIIDYCLLPRMYCIELPQGQTFSMSFESGTVSHIHKVIYTWCTLQMDHKMVKPLIHIWNEKQLKNQPRMKGKGGVHNDKEMLCVMLWLLLLNQSRRQTLLTQKGQL